MLSKEATLFISDLHLSAHKPHLTTLFTDFLREIAPKAQALYILGDLFDAWVGNDIEPQWHQALQEQLQALHSQGIALYFMPGNRDFLVTDRFLETACLKRLKDPSYHLLYGIPTLLTHGDLLCTQDKKYQYYRRVAQHAFTRRLFLRLPQKTREKIRDKLRYRSQIHQRQQSPLALDVTEEATQTFFLHFQVQHLIHGHVHRPKIYQESGKRKRLVLGDWNGTGSVLIHTPKTITLATYSPPSELLPQEQLFL